MKGGYLSESQVQIGSRKFLYLTEDMVSTFV